MDGVPSRINLGVVPESAADRAHDKLYDLRAWLASQGWNEAVTDSLVESAWVDESVAAAVNNPLNEQYTYLRTSLKSSLLAVAGRNLARGVAGVRLFEAGKTFRKESGKLLEPMRLGLLVAGEGAEEAWYQSPREADFGDIKGVFDELLGRRNFEDADLLEMARVPPSIAKIHGIKVPVFYAEIDLTLWLSRRKPTGVFAELPNYPAVRRDIAVIVDRDLPQAKVVSASRGLKLKSLERVTLFDVFTDDKGEKIPSDKKSLAYALTYRAPDRTLTDQEVSKWQDKVLRQLERQLGAVLRDA